MPCAISQEYAYDLGSQQLNRQTFVVMLNLEKSKDLIVFIARKLGYRATSLNTTALFLVTRTFDRAVSTKLGEVCLSYEETIFLTHVDKSKRRMSRHVITAEGIVFANSQSAKQE